MERFARVPDTWRIMRTHTDGTTATRDRYLDAMKFGEMLATVTKHQDLVLTEDWCGDAVNVVPVVIVYDDAFEAVAWWGPRPAALQAWVLGPGKSLKPEAKYREVRAWYARDRGGGRGGNCGVDPNQNSNYVNRER